MGKNAGPDLISNEVIKCSSIITIKSITKLLNSFLTVGASPLAGENHILY
jgi:hypothetical protein